MDLQHDPPRSRREHLVVRRLPGGEAVTLDLCTTATTALDPDTARVFLALNGELGTVGLAASVERDQTSVETALARLDQAGLLEPTSGRSWRRRSVLTGGSLAVLMPLAAAFAPSAAAAASAGATSISGGSSAGSGTVTVSGDSLGTLSVAAAGFTPGAALTCIVNPADAAEPVNTPGQTTVGNSTADAQADASGSFTFRWSSRGVETSATWTVTDQADGQAVTSASYPLQRD